MSPGLLRHQVTGALAPLRELLLQAENPMAFDVHERVAAHHDAWSKALSGWMHHVSDFVESWPLPNFTELAPGAVPGLMDFFPLMDEGATAGRELLVRKQERAGFSTLYGTASLGPTLRGALRPAERRLGEALRLDAEKCRSMSLKIEQQEQLLQGFFMQGLTL